MRIRTLQREQWAPLPQAEVFAFFSEASNLDRITPPWLNFGVVRQTENETRAGTLIDYRLAWHGMSLAWTSRIEEWRPPFQFIDVQLKGPYSLWHHTHRFEVWGRGTLISDQVRYSLPFGFLGDLCAGWLVRKDVEQIFDYRARAIAAIFSEQSVTTKVGRQAYR